MTTMAKIKEEKMKKIYLDMEQCEKFDVQYMSFCQQHFFVKANELLESKSNGYDEEHIKYLKSFGNDIIRVFNNETAHPGWFEVE